MRTPEYLTVLAILLWAGAANGEPVVVDLGMPLSEEQLAPYDITIFPDGRKLPPGRGSVADGEVLYQERCATCHGKTGTEGPAARLAGSDGFFGWDDPLRVIRIAKYPPLILSVGARWPYATTIFDYVRRAMPHYAPKSLSDAQVYAVTGYLLYLNGLVKKSAVMDKENLPKVVMPAQSHSVSAWPPRD